MLGGCWGLVLCGLLPLTVEDSHSWAPVTLGLGLQRYGLCWYQLHAKPVLSHEPGTTAPEGPKRPFETLPFPVMIFWHRLLSRKTITWSHLSPGHQCRNPAQICRNL